MAKTARHTIGPDAPRAEADAIASRSIIVAAVALLLIIVVGAGVISLLEREFSHALVRAGPGIDAPALPPVTGPPPQSAPQGELAAYRAEKSNWLNEYGWTDRKSGVVHLPIDRAMALTTQRHATGNSQ
jgi:hypothetical protein